DLLDAIEGLLFLLGWGGLVAQGTEVAKHELDGLVKSARGFTLPHFPKTPAPDRFDQPIARNRLGVRFPDETHWIQSMVRRSRAEHGGKLRVRRDHSARTPQRSLPDATTAKL